MRTLNVHSADELQMRWKARAMELDLRAEGGYEQMTYAAHIKAHMADLDRERAQAYRVCAAELAAIVAVTMEQEAIHHGDPEQSPDFETKLMEWSQGRRP
jgi:hypothetical protein